MPLDFSTAEKQAHIGLIPSNTAAPVHMTLRPGGHGDGSWLKKSQGTAPCLMMDCEFTVLSGPYARRKFWSLMTVQGETEGQQKAVTISHSRLRAILESINEIMPSDESAAAVKARQVNGYQDFDGVRFMAIVGIEKGKDGYQDKNVLAGAVTPDKTGYERVEQLPASQRGQSTGSLSRPAASAPKSSGAKPSWASDDTIPF